MLDDSTGAVSAPVVRYLCELRWQQHGCMNPLAPTEWGVENVGEFGPMLLRRDRRGWSGLDDEDDGRCVIYDVRTPITDAA